MTHPEKTLASLAQHMASVADLTQKLSAAANGANHSELLDALLQLTIRVAKTHTCCTRDAATGCLLASSHLQAHMLKHPLVYAPPATKTTH